MEQIEVTVRFNSEGKITPLNFTWNGQEFVVESTGRQWTDDEGQHILVMLPGGRVYELLFTPSDRLWYLKRVGLDRMAA